MIALLCAIDLFFFMGSEEHPWSRKLSEEVLTKPEFTETLKEELTLIPIVCSDELEERYKVREFPTLVLVDSTGEVIYKTSYLPLEAKSFALHFKKVLKDYRELKSALSCVETLQEEEMEGLYMKAKALGGSSQEILDKALKKRETPFFLLEQYAELWRTRKRTDPEIAAMRKKIEQSDPKNFKSTQLHLALIEFKALSVKLKKKEDPLNPIRPLMAYLQKVDDPENAWTIEMVIAQYLMRKNRIKEALAHAEVSRDLAPDFAKAELSETVHYLSDLNQNINP